MQAIDRTLGALDRWLVLGFATSRTGLALSRVVFAAYLLLIGAHDFTWVSSVPDALFHPPPGPLWLFSGFPSAWLLVAARSALVAASFCLLFGVRTLPAGMIATGSLLFLYGAAYCTGKITHNVLFVVAPLFLGLTGGGAQKPRYWSLSLFAFLLAFMMLTAGIPKLAFGWLSLDSSAVRSYALEARKLRAPVLGELPFAVPWETLDWATIALECSFIACVWQARWFRVACAFAILFHAAVLAMLDISFATNVIAYALFYDWTPVAARTHRLRRWLGDITSRLRWWHCLGLAGIYVLAFREAPLNELLHGLGLADRVAIFATAGDIVLTCVAAVLALGFLLLQGSTAIARPYTWPVKPRSSDGGSTGSTAGPAKSGS